MASDRNESGAVKTGAGTPLAGEAAKHIGGAARETQTGKDAALDEGSQTSLRGLPPRWTA